MFRRGSRSNELTRVTRLGWCGLSFFLVLMPAVGPTAGCSRWVCPPYYMDTCSGRVPASAQPVGQGLLLASASHAATQVGQMWPQMGPIAQLARRVALRPLFKIFILAPGDPRVVRASRSRLHATADTVTDSLFSDRAHSMLVHTHTHLHTQPEATRMLTPAGTHTRNQPNRTAQAALTAPCVRGERRGHAIRERERDGL